MEYYLVIVKYNNSDVTINCIQSTKKILGKKFSKIMVVDNNSNDLDRNRLCCFIKKESCVNIELLKLDSNIGYFPAINQGILALGLFGKRDFFLVIGNNDLFFPNNFIKKLSAIVVDENIFVISPDILTPQGIHQNPHVIHRISFFRRLLYKFYFCSYPIAYMLTFLGGKLNLNRREVSRKGYEKEQIIRMGFGACYIILPQFIQKVGLLDESVFLMGEEALLGNQVYSHNGKILYTPRVCVYHQDHSTFKKMPPRSTYYITRKSYRIYKKYL